MTHRFAAPEDVAWIRDATPVGLTITSAIPPVFEAYATVLDPEEGRAESVAAILQVLRDHTPAESSWWVGYLDTGADDVVFPEVTRTRLYSGWGYVVVNAIPGQVQEWRQDPSSWRAPGPDLAFPEDRSWLMSWLWDDTWRCFGGSTAFIDDLLGQDVLQARRVHPGEDATPPGRRSY